MSDRITRIENKVYDAVNKANKKAADLQAAVDKAAADYDTAKAAADTALKAGNVEEYVKMSGQMKIEEARKSAATTALKEMSETPQITAAEYDALAAEIFAATAEVCNEHKQKVRQLLNDCIKIRSEDKAIIERADKALETLQGSLYKYADLNGEPRRTSLGENPKILRFRDITVLRAVYDAVSPLNVRNILCKVDPRSGISTDPARIKWTDGPLSLD